MRLNSNREGRVHHGGAEDPEEKTLANLRALCDSVVIQGSPGFRLSLIWIANGNQNEIVLLRMNTRGSLSE